MARNGNGSSKSLHQPDALVPQFHSNTEEANVEIPDLGADWLTVEIRGLTPLIHHRFSDKARKQIERKQQKKAAVAREARDPEQETRDALYLLVDDDGKPYDPPRYGFPAAAFKKAAVSAGRQVDGVTMTLARGAFHVYGDGRSVDNIDLVEIHTNGGWRKRTDVVRLESGVASMAYRPEFRDWTAKLRIRHLPSIAPSQIIHLINVAGFAVGVGENRPEKSGDTFGQFEVIKRFVEEVKA